jgi:hypothetical protein
MNCPACHGSRYTRYGYCDCTERVHEHRDEQHWPLDIPVTALDFENPPAPDDKGYDF